MDHNLKPNAYFWQKSRRMAKNLFNRYIWLVDTIYRNGPLTLKEINDRWMKSDFSEGEAIPLRTFHNHRAAIQEMFDIDIACDRRRNEYYIEDAESLSAGHVRNWLLNTFSVSNMLNESYKLRGRILFENVPSGQKFLTPILEAMRENRVLRMTYKGYERTEPHRLEVYPYFVKIFRQRWYMAAFSTEQQQVRIYALDRILALEDAGSTFVFPRTFDAEEYMSGCFGIMRDNTPVQRILLRVSGSQANYLRALPLHRSQEETETTDEGAVFSYYLSPTFDFYQEILSYGASVEVLSPEPVRSRMQEMTAQMSRLYGGKKRKNRIK